MGTYDTTIRRAAAWARRHNRVAYVMACAYRWHIGSTPPYHQNYLAISPDGTIKSIRYVPEGYPGGAEAWEADRLKDFEQRIAQAV